MNFEIPNMNRIYSLLFFLFFGFNIGFSQEKIFLSSESNWVVVLDYWDWNEDNVENYSGKYEYIHAANDEYGNYNGEGDGYNYITDIRFNSGEILVLGYGSIEGTFQEIDTMSSSKIMGNTFRDNQKFIFLKYKTRKKEIKTVKGLLELNENKKIESFSEYFNQNEISDATDNTLSFDLFDNEINFRKINIEKLTQLFPNLMKEDIYNKCCPAIFSYFVNKVIVSGSGHSDATFNFFNNKLFQINIQTEWDDETEKELDKLVSNFILSKTESKYEPELGRDMVEEFYIKEKYSLSILYYRFKVYSIVDESLKSKVKKLYSTFEEEY